MSDGEAVMFMMLMMMTVYMSRAVGEIPATKQVICFFLISQVE
jgi:hypothetical protein